MQFFQVHHYMSVAHAHSDIINLLQDKAISRWTICAIGFLNGVAGFSIVLN